MSLPSTDRLDLIQQARYSIDDGDMALNEAGRYRGDASLTASARAKALYARASVLVQMAGYLGMAEEAEGRKAAVEAFIRSNDIDPERELAEERSRGFSDDEIAAFAKRLNAYIGDTERQRQDDYIAGRELEAGNR